MKIKALTSTLVLTLVGVIPKTYAVTVWTFQKTKDTAGNESTQVDGVRSIIDVISLINTYLRFAVWLCCFLFMIWNWFKLISANGDNKATSSARKSLIWSWIALAVCLMAYIIVNLAVKLFA